MQDKITPTNNFSAHATTSGSQAPLMMAVAADDPFFTEDHMDTREDIVNPNASTTEAPNPSNLDRPKGIVSSFFVVTVGQPVGILTDIRAINLHLQSQFCMTQFADWYQAIGYYTEYYFANRIRIMPTHAQIQQQLSTPSARGAAYMPSGSGSAENPICLDIPVSSNRVATVSRSQVSAPPAPAPRRKGKGKAKASIPPGASAAHKAGPNLQSNQSTSTKRPAPATNPTAALVIDVSDVEADVPPRHLKARPTAVQQPVPLAVQESGVQVPPNPVVTLFPPSVRIIVIDDSDSDGELDHLPRYPKAPSTPPQVDHPTASSPSVPEKRSLEKPVDSPNFAICLPTQKSVAQISKSAATLACHDSTSAVGTSAQTLSVDSAPAPSAVVLAPASADLQPVSDTSSRPSVIAPATPTEVPDSAPSSPVLHNVEATSSWAKLLKFYADVHLAPTPAGRELAAVRDNFASSNPATHLPASAPDGFVNAVAGPSNISADIGNADVDNSTAAAPTTDNDADSTVATAAADSDFEMSDMDPEYLEAVGRVLDSLHYNPPSKSAPTPQASSSSD